jgi:hypothetical protein
VQKFFEQFTLIQDKRQDIVGRRQFPHDKQSAFLGYTKPESDKWLAEIQNAKTENDFEQLKMF